MRLNKMFTTLILGSSLAAAPLAYAADAAVPPMAPQQQKQVEQVIRDYLIKNPQVIVDSLQTLQKQQMDQARQTIEKTQQNAPNFANDLFHQTNDPIEGNANGTVTVVDFFDYQCPHCTRMTPILEALISSNPNLRVVFKEFPIRGPLSEFASKAALAAKNQGKYLDLHRAIMKLAIDQKLSEDAITKAAAGLGIDVNKLKADMKSDAVNQVIKSNYKLAQSLQLMGTPAFFVAKTTVANGAKPAAIVFIPGQVDQPQLKATIDKVNQ